jgi:hypothetical protein
VVSVAAGSPGGGEPCDCDRAAAASLSALPAPARVSCGGLRRGGAVHTALTTAAGLLVLLGCAAAAFACVMRAHPALNTVRRPPARNY